MVKCLYPRNFKSFLAEYNEEDHPDLREGYKNRFKREFESLYKKYEKITKKEIENHHIHEQLRSCCIIPFIYQKVDKYELLNLEPLAHAKFKREIEDIPIFDFMIVGIHNNNLERVILGEVKGGDRGSNLGDLTDFEIHYNQDSIRNRIFEMISKTIPHVKFDKTRVKFHFVLAIDEMDSDNYRKSVKDRNLNLEIWEIKSSLFRQKFSIEIETLPSYNKTLPENYIYNKLINELLKQNEFNKVLDFSFKTDTSVILNYIKEAYIGVDNPEIDKDRLMKLIYKKMCGDFIEEEEIIEIVYNRILKKGKQTGIIMEEDGKLRFKRVDPIEYITKYRIQKRIDKTLGKEFLDETASNLRINKKIDKSKYRSMDEFLTKKK